MVKSMIISLIWLSSGLVFLLLASASQAFSPVASKVRFANQVASSGNVNVMPDAQRENHGIHQPFQTPANSNWHGKSTTSLYGGLFGGKSDGKQESQSQSSEADSALPTRVLEIPVSSLKQGGLRFSLGLHLVGLQDKGTWRPNESSSNQLDVFFKDNSAMFSIVLKADAICVDRYGQPSLMYMLQESVLLHGVLDELNELAFGGDIELQNRLLQLEQPDSIETARSTLPARAA